ncbi:YmgD family protein [Aliiruegeria lutimaris]|nr:YmgD family protein [Aliiruegeria lutimaris]
MALCSPAFADEEMDRILDEAMPYMHHSCESVLANYGEDEEKVAEIVRLMAEVSLFNREINVEEAVPDEAERDGLKDKFVEALEEACEADPDALLAGAVDLAVKDALN